MQVEEGSEESDEDASVMQRMEAESDATSAIIRVQESEATSQSESVMQRVDDDDDQTGKAKDSDNSSSVPRELRQLGRV